MPVARTFFSYFLHFPWNWISDFLWTSLPSSSFFLSLSFVCIPGVYYLCDARITYKIWLKSLCLQMDKKKEQKMWQKSDHQSPCVFTW